MSEQLKRTHRSKVKINILLDALSPEERAEILKSIKDWLREAEPIVEEVDKFLADAENSQGRETELLKEAGRLLGQISQLPKLNVFRGSVRNE